MALAAWLPANMMNVRWIQFNSSYCSCRTCVLSPPLPEEEETCTVIVVAPTCTSCVLPLPRASPLYYSNMYKILGEDKVMVDKLAPERLEAEYSLVSFSLLCQPCVPNPFRM